MTPEYIFPEKIVIVVDDRTDTELCFAADFLKEEICLRSGEIFLVTDNTETEGYPIAWKRDAELGAEEFSLVRSDAGIEISASEKRGFLYGAAWVLRKMYLKAGRVGISRELESVKIHPSYPMRGHQLGYRDKQNTCPAWTEKEYERYIRDLLIFGSNAIEILPPRTDDNLYSSHFKRDPFQMMIHLSEIIHSYGMEVHVWYPYLSLTAEGEIFQKEMEERENIFRSVPYIDGLLIPAGDPGDLPPGEMIMAAEATAKLLHTYHPDAKVWLAPQAFAPEEGWYEEFYREIRKEPDWLYGVCFGPWEKDPIEEMYRKLPEKYRGTIRNYPDITHNISSQFEVPDWDEAFAYTLGREAYNTRPYAFRIIHDYHKGYVRGSITYSEGIHDDVNKMIWGNLDYQEEEPVEHAVRDYVRLFIDPDWTEELSDILLRLEDSWKGKILENPNIDLLYEHMMAVDERADQKTRENFRYQLLLLRILGDYQTKLRYAHDQMLEREAYEIMRDQHKTADQIIEDVRTVLRKTYTEPVGVKERFRLQRLGDELYHSCKIQLTTTRHKGQWLERGAWLDTLNMALNDSQWINASLNRIQELSGEEEKKAAISRMVNRCNPGPGGWYFHLGSFEGFAHVKKTGTFAEDPCFVKSPLMAHSSHLIAKMYQSIGWYDEVPLSVKWTHGARTLYGTPLVVTVDGLDPEKEYELTVTYQNILLTTHMNVNLYAGEELIHTEVNRTYGPGEDWDPSYTYSLPKSAYPNGHLPLTWKSYQPEGACTVCEIWIRCVGK